MSSDHFTALSTKLLTLLLTALVEHLNDLLRTVKCTHERSENWLLLVGPRASRRLTHRNFQRGILTLKKLECLKDFFLLA